MKNPISETAVRNAMVITLTSELECIKTIERLGFNLKNYSFCEGEIGVDCQLRIENLKLDSVIVKNTNELWTMTADEDQLLGFLKVISEKKIRFISIEDQIDLNASQAELILLLLEQYRAQAFHQRSRNVRIGIQQAKKSGKALGRPAKCDSKKIRELRHQGFTIQKIAEALKISVGSVHRGLSGC